MNNVPFTYYTYSCVKNCELSTLMEFGTTVKELLFLNRILSHLNHGQIYWMPLYPENVQWPTILWKLKYQKFVVKIVFLSMFTQKKYQQTFL